MDKERRLMWLMKIFLLSFFLNTNYSIGFKVHAVYAATLHEAIRQVIL